MKSIRASEPWAFDRRSRIDHSSKHNSAPSSNPVKVTGVYCQPAAHDVSRGTWHTGLSVEVPAVSRDCLNLHRSHFAAIN